MLSIVFFEINIIEIDAKKTRARAKVSTICTWRLPEWASIFDELKRSIPEKKERNLLFIII